MVRYQIAAVVLLSVLAVSSSLKCYQCSSESDPECLENFDTGNKDRFLESTDCDIHGSLYCIKTTGIYGGVVGTRRFCSSRDFHDMCQYITYPDHDRVYRACVFTCSGDSCNSALKSGHSYTTAVITSVVAILQALHVLY